MRILKFFRTKTQMILLASFLVLLSFTTFEAAPVYNSHDCTEYETTYYQPNSNFQNTLNTLLSSLISNATLHNGFYSIHIPLQTPNDLKGLFLCRADVTPSLCQNCVTAAANNITKLCNNQTESIIWYDECLLRYSNDSVLDHMVPSITLDSDETVPDSEFTQFSGFLANLLKGIAQEAVNSDVKFATKEVNFIDSMKIYSSAQCTPDLSTFGCNTCLQDAISSIGSCCNHRRGARSLHPSCNLRYEVYPFYNVSADSTQPQISSPSSGKSKVSIVIAVVVPILVAVVLFSIGCLFLLKRARKKYKYNAFIQSSSSIRSEDLTDVDCFQFDFATVEAATNCFSYENKIGQGGFGIVYKGILSNGQEIAVKRLSVTSLQGALEFRNEASLVAKLQHRNLTRLFGFCMEGCEKMLIYEYIPNKSLDHFLFDHAKQRELDWSRRYKIIVGIARGILYLHEDSQLRIIHRDLKASNVLLDENMNPKISDFGMARIFQADHTQVNTGRIVGTYGYMSPESAMRGQFSVKSDVFSFGVLVLEIVSGKKNTDLNQRNNAEDLLSYAWKKWSEQTPLELLDPTLQGSCSRNEVIRCIHMGLLCVQENPNDRPFMETIALMLNSYSVTLSLPRQPPSFLRGRTPCENKLYN
uniref:Cysteine-rich receptor-like protein kinase 10 isoform X2 n=1 Tax=Cicer arietinum TaxID=3827 RepID=A0A3Q7X6J7_CICAR|nr:cysteine-rich receptor-like protein kinase 10 isoform X2 [Cicer arietinum]